MVQEHTFYSGIMTVSTIIHCVGVWIFTFSANLKELISQTITTWAQQSHIQDPELVRVMFSLLRRQYDGIGELLRAMKKSYTISAASVLDAINLLASLGQIRSLLSVRMGNEEEKLMIDGLGYENTMQYMMQWNHLDDLLHICSSLLILTHIGITLYCL